MEPRKRLTEESCSIENTYLKSKNFYFPDFREKRSVSRLLMPALSTVGHKRLFFLTSIQGSLDY